MPSNGKSIRIFLPSGDVTGIRHVEVVNWTGQATVIPRARLGDLKDWEKETQRTGVYFLLGNDEGKDAVYIGEAEDGRTRVKQHLSKPFWKEAVIITSKDENLTKSHIKYLESRLYEIATQAGRFFIKNETAPTKALLPKADVNAMEEFIGNVRLLLGILGYKVLEKIEASIVSGEKELDALSFSTKSLSAKGYPSNEGFVIISGSQAAGNIASSMPKYYVRIRTELLEDGVL